MRKTKKTTQRIFNSIEELPLEARLRAENEGRWIAWAPDFKSLVAVGDDFESIHEAVRQAGSPRAIYEWVAPEHPRPLDMGQ